MRKIWEEQQKRRSSSVNGGLLKGYMKRDKRIQVRPKTPSIGLLDWQLGGGGFFPLSYYPHYINKLGLVLRANESPWGIKLAQNDTTLSSLMMHCKSTFLFVFPFF